MINYFRVNSKERNAELNFPELRKQLDALKAAYPALSQAQTLAEDAVRRKTWILIRGDYRSHGIEVQPGTPGFLQSMPSDPNHRA